MRQPIKFPFCKAVRAQHPDVEIVVVTAHPEIFAGIPCVHKTISPADLGGTYSQIIVLSPQTVDESRSRIHQWCATHGIDFMGQQPEAVFGTDFLHGFKERFSGKGQPIPVVGEWGGETPFD